MSFSRYDTSVYRRLLTRRRGDLLNTSNEGVHTVRVLANGRIFARQTNDNANIARRINTQRDGPLFRDDEIGTQTSKNIRRRLSLTRLHGFILTRRRSVFIRTNRRRLTLNRRLYRQLVNRTRDFNVQLTNTTMVNGINARRLRHINSRFTKRARPSSTYLRPNSLRQLIPRRKRPGAIRSTNRLVRSMLRGTTITMIPSTRRFSTTNTNMNSVRVNTFLEVRTTTRTSMASVQTTLSRVFTRTKNMTRGCDVNVSSTLRSLIVTNQSVTMRNRLFYVLVRFLLDKKSRASQLGNRRFIRRLRDPPLVRTCEKKRITRRNGCTPANGNTNKETSVRRNLRTLSLNNSTIIITRPTKCQIRNRTNSLQTNNNRQNNGDRVRTTKGNNGNLLNVTNRRNNLFNVNRRIINPCQHITRTLNSNINLGTYHLNRLLHLNRRNSNLRRVGTTGNATYRVRLNATLRNDNLSLLMGVGIHGNAGKGGSRVRTFFRCERDRNTRDLRQDNLRSMLQLRHRRNVRVIARNATRHFNDLFHQDANTTNRTRRLVIQRRAILPYINRGITRGSTTCSAGFYFRVLGSFFYFFREGRRVPLGCVVSGRGVVWWNTEGRGTVSGAGRLF